MKYLLIIIATLCFSTISAQYDVLAFQDRYEEIDDYNSIALETFGDLYWEKEFNMDFYFPYFDTIFNKITCDVEGTCRFENDLDFSLRLMTFGYMYDNVVNPDNIESDVRYKFGKKSGQNYLVVQLTKNRLFSDPSVDDFDSHVNFQYWFYEDGTIELRFGPSNLDHSPVYVPGEGFYLLTNQGPIPSGPQLALYHPFDEDIRLEYNDLESHEQYELNTDGSGSIDWWPPEGWVIRFTNQLVSTQGVDKKSSIDIHPNPTTGTVFIDSDEEVIKFEVYNSNGKIVDRGYNRQIDLFMLESGMYFLRILTRQSQSIHKILKI